MKAKVPKALPRIKGKFYEPEAGEWITPNQSGYRLACCDCGLTHTFVFRVRQRKAEFAIFLNKRATAAVRRKPLRFVRNTRKFGG